MSGAFTPRSVWNGVFIFALIQKLDGGHNWQNGARHSCRFNVGTPWSSITAGYAETEAAFKAALLRQDIP